MGDLPLPMSRRAECRASLHVCRMCLFYDTKLAKSSREPIAEPVQDKTRANFCGYFQPNPARGNASQKPANDARAAAEALFGDKPAASPAAERKDLDDWFKSLRKKISPPMRA